MKCLITVVKFNLPLIEARCIKSVLDNTVYPYDLMVYDNWAKRENLGKLWNKLIERTDAKYICLLNSDCEIKDRNWLEILIETMEKYHAGAIGPSTNKCHGPQMWDGNKDPLIKVFDEYGDNWQLSGFCLIFPKEIWEKVGGFPEGFGFYGQEAAFLLKVRRLGYKQLWHRGVMVEHIGGASIKKASEYGIIDEQYERKLGRENYSKVLNK